MIARETIHRLFGRFDVQLVLWIVCHRITACLLFFPDGQELFSFPFRCGHENLPSIAFLLSG